MIRENKTAIALGSFDGLHKGHRSVITCALKYKERGFVPVILLFDEHPLKALTGIAPPEILQPGIRDEILADYGITPDFISFSEIKGMSPEDFFKNILTEKLNAGALCCGSNYRFGRDGAGDCGVLKKLCEKYGIELSVADDTGYDGSLISSSRIRTAIENGNIKAANEMLGRKFTYRAEVKTGYRRGHLIGFPTINQYFDSGFIKPKAGVYASVTKVDGVLYPSVTNIGFRPSFENEDFRSETCIIGFDGDLYGRSIDVSLSDFLRNEIKFDDIEDLKQQVAADAQISVKKFGEES